MSQTRWYLVVVVFVWSCLLSHVAQGCTTFVVGPKVTSDGSVLSSHSNDGDGDTAGNVVKVIKKTWRESAMRRVSNGFIPQVPATHGYMTKVGGYASVSDQQVGLAESTCVSIFAGNRSSAKLNIVDLSELCLERAKTALQCIEIMGSLAEQYGYYDAGESLLVTDPRNVYVFHVTPDDTGTSAVWVAQRVPDDHVAVVTNMFTIRVVDLTDPGTFVFSSNLVSVASRATEWTSKKPLDFTLYFSGAEGRKYVSGRRMWRALELLTNRSFPSTYENFVIDAPYPATAKSHIKISATNMREIMRDYFENTSYSLSARGTMAGGPFGSPDRSTPGDDEKALDIYFERTISTHRSIVSYVLQLSSWLPNDIGATIWYGTFLYDVDPCSRLFFSRTLLSPIPLSFFVFLLAHQTGMHAAHTTVYIPFVVGIDRMPSTHTNNTLARVDRYVGAFNAARFVFNIAQMHFNLAILDIKDVQSRLEYRSELLLRQLQNDFMLGNASLSYLSDSLRENAKRCVREWWDLSDQLVLRYADGYCNGCGRGSRHLGYPPWWLRAVSESGA